MMVITKNLLFAVLLGLSISMTVSAQSDKTPPKNPPPKVEPKEKPPKEKEDKPKKPGFALAVRKSEAGDNA